MAAISRRRALVGVASGFAAGASVSMLWVRRAFAAEATLIGVEWGGSWLEAAKEVTAKQTKFDVK